MEKSKNVVASTDNRIEWIDIYKGILIILVVIGHATGKFNGWIYQFHMAAFFFVSGYLSSIEKNNDFSYLVKKILTLLLPLFTFVFVGAALNCLINKLNAYELLFGSNFIGFFKTLYEFFFHGYNYIQYLGTCWFLCALFGIELLQFILFWCSNRKINYLYYIFSCILYFIGYWLIKYGVTAHIGIFDIDIIFIAQIYFNVGILIRKNKFFELIESSGVKANLLIMGVCLLTTLWGKMNGITVDYPSRKFSSPIAEFIVAIASIVIVFYVSKCIMGCNKKISRCLRYFGRNSLGIMILHFFFFKIFMLFLYLQGWVDSSQIVNVVLLEELQPKYWIILTIFSLVCSVGTWTFLIKIPYLRFLLGQDKKINNKIINYFSSNSLNQCYSKIISIENRLYNIGEKHKAETIAGIVLVILFSIPMYRTGIIINDELQARCLAMQGFKTFYLKELRGWIKQGRLLAAPINSFTKYLSFIGAKTGTSFRIGSIIILLAVVLTFGIFIYKLFGNKLFAIFLSLIALACMPIGFEHCSPNAFVGFIAFSTMMIFISLTCYIQFIDTKRKKYLLISMLLFLLTMMSYEAFITFCVLYMLIVLGKTGSQHIKGNIVLYIYPCITSFIFLFCYALSSYLCPSQYGGNQLGFDTLQEPLNIILNLFIVCLPGFFVFFPRYQYFKQLYYNLDSFDYCRIIAFTLIFASLIFLVLKKLNKNSIETSGTEFNDIKQNKMKEIYILFCGLSYMVLPSLPNAVSKMYQGNVGFTGNFLMLPITFAEYFAAIFVIGYILWLIVRGTKNRFYLVVVGCLTILVLNVQQMNDIFSKEQNKNFSRLLKIEAFLGTAVSRDLFPGEYYSHDLYKQQNALAIHDGYWSDYCHNVVGLQLDISAEKTGDEIGSIFYDDDNFVVIDPLTIHVISSDREQRPKAIQVSDNEYVIFDFQGENVTLTEDNTFYVYSIPNTISVGCVPLSGYSKDGWIGKTSTYNISPGSNKNIEVNLYYPGGNFAGKEISVYINDNLDQIVSITDNTIKFSVHLKEQESVTLKLECNFIYEEKNNNDIRTLSLLLTSMDLY